MVNQSAAPVQGVMTVTGLVPGDWAFTIEAYGGGVLLFEQTASITLTAGPNTLALTMVAVPAAEFAGGTGTDTDPYLVATALQLSAVRNHLDAIFVQTTDIDLVGVDWIPIGTLDQPFTGTYVGNGHQINNMIIHQSGTDAIGLFGAVVGTISPDHQASVSQVWLNDAGVIGNNQVGALVGYLGANALVFGSYSTGLVEGTSVVGGLVGTMGPYSEIDQSFSLARVTAVSTTAGGLAGILDATGNSAWIFNSFATGKVSGGPVAGGLVGEVHQLNGGSAQVESCYAAGPLKGTTNVGGAFGYAPEGVSSSAVFYDSDKNGLSDTTGNAVPLKSDVMALQASFAGYNFTSVWTNTEGLSAPYFSWVPSALRPSAVFMGGQGTFADPYQVATPSQLNKVRLFLNSSFKQTADIDMGVAPFDVANGGFVPIGNSSGQFHGSFDGAGGIITNLYIDRTGFTGDVGLFGNVSVNKDLVPLAVYGLFANITVWDATVVSVSGGSAGVLIGSLSDSDNGADATHPVIGYCLVTGVLSGAATNTGGLVGIVTGGDASHPLLIQNTEADVALTVGSSFNHGGLIGQMQNVRLYRCAADGDVTASIGNRAGGLVGYATFPNVPVSIEESFAVGAVTGQNTTGGLVGYAEGSVSQPFIVKNSYARGAATSTNMTSGTAAGLVGESGAYVTLETSYTTSMASVSIGNVYALVGLKGSNLVVTNCVFSTALTGNTDSVGINLTAADLMNSTTMAGTGFSASVWDVGTLALPFLLCQN